MGIEPAHAQADGSWRYASGPDERRIQPAGGVLRRATAGAFARTAPRSFALAQRGSLRSLDRRPDPPAASQDRDGPLAARIHQDRAWRRLCLRRAGGSPVLSVVAAARFGLAAISRARRTGC